MTMMIMVQRKFSTMVRERMHMVQNVVQQWTEKNELGISRSKTRLFLLQTDEKKKTKGNIN